MHAIQSQYQPNTLEAVGQLFHLQPCHMFFNLAFINIQVVLNRPESTTYFIDKTEAMKDKLSTSNFPINKIN